MITEISIQEADLDVINTPNGCLIRDVDLRGSYFFVPDISWDDENYRFTILPKRRTILTQK